MHTKRPYLRQKPVLFFDENFPFNVVESFSKTSYWLRKYKFINAIKKVDKGKSDSFLFSYCKKMGYTLVTLDMDFVDDKNFSFGNMPGVIMVKASRNEHSRIVKLIESFLTFINLIPLPKNFLGDSKFILSNEGCVMWGRDARTRELKKFHIIADKTTLNEVRDRYNY